MALEVQVFDLACAFECDADAHDVTDGPDLISYEDGVAVELDLKMMVGFSAFDLLPLCEVAAEGAEVMVFPAEATGAKV